MSDPKPLSADLSQLMATLERLQVKVASIESSADYLERVADVQAGNDRRAERELEELCDERDVPAEPGIRRVSMLQSPPFTPAIQKVQLSMTARAMAQRGLPRGARQPLVLVLSGPPGCGKTTAMSWATAQHKRAAAYVPARVIAGTPRNGWSENEAKWQRWARVDLLAIDELGTEGGNTELVGALLSERHDLGGVTLCATNCGIATFQARYCNERLISRLAHGPGWWCELGDVDLRNPANRAAMAEVTW